MVTGALPTPVTIDVTVAAQTATIVINGELDLTSTPLLARHLAGILGGGPRRLVFGMAGVGFIDCAALRLIAGTGRYLPAGQRPVIRRPSPAVRRMLALTGFAAQCEIDGCPGEAPGG
jgi:anti-anti-sigma factor